MAKLSTFTRDPGRIAEGELIAVGQADDPFMIRTRGFSPAYRDTLARLRLKASREQNRNLQPGQIPTTPDSLPPTVDDRCQAEALNEHCLIDVQGLTNDDGSAVTIDQFKQLLPNSPGLLFLAIGAASRVGADRAEQTKAAEGN